MPLAWLFPAVLAVLLLAKAGYLDLYNTPAIKHISPGTLTLSQPTLVQSTDEVSLLESSYKDQNLVLYWQANATPTRDYSVRLHFTDAAGIMHQVVTRLHPGYSPAMSWEPGQLVEDDYVLVPGPFPHTGVYSLTVELYSQDPVVKENITTYSRVIDTVTVPSVSVTDSLAIDFGQIRLDSFSLPATIVSGKSGNLVLNWRSLGAIDDDLTMFLHLLKPDDTLVWAADSKPLRGNYPTTFWQPNDTITDTVTFQVPQAAGKYQVEIGWYDTQTGNRLPPTGLGATDSGSVILGTINVLPNPR